MKEYDVDFKDYEEDQVYTAIDLLPAYNEENEDKKSVQVRQVYNNLQTMEEKLGYIVYLKAIFAVGDKEEENITLKMREEAEAIENEFINNYIKNGSQEDREKAFRVMAQLDAEQNVSFYNEVNDLKVKVANGSEEVTSKYEKLNKPLDQDEIDRRAFFFAFKSPMNQEMHDALRELKDTFEDEIDNELTVNELNEKAAKETVKYYKDNNISAEMQAEISNQQQKVRDADYKDGIRDWAQDYGNDLADNRVYTGLSKSVHKCRQKYVHKGLKNAELRDSLQKNDEPGRNDSFKQIYNSLETMQEKIEFLVDYKTNILAKTDMGDDVTADDAAYYEMLSKFTEEYCTDKLKDYQGVYETIGNVNAKYGRDLNNEKKRLLDQYVPENAERRNKKGNYLMRYSNVNTAKVMALNEISVMVMQNMEGQLDQCKELLGINENTTMGELADKLGYQGAYRAFFLNKKIDNEPINENTKFYDYIKAEHRRINNNIDPNELMLNEDIKIFLREDMPNAWRLKGTGKNLDEMNLSEQERKEVEAENGLAVSEISREHIEEWADKINPTLAQEKFESNVAYRKAFDQKYTEMGKKIQYTEFTYKLNKVQAVRNLLIDELYQFKSDLAFTQKNADANYNNEIAPEGSNEYQEMTKAIQAAIVAITTHRKSFAEVFAAIEKACEKSRAYHTAKEGVFGGPRSDNGIARYNTSESFYDKIAGLSDAFKRAINEYKEYGTKNNYVHFEENDSLYDIEGNFKIFSDTMITGQGIQLPDKTNDAKAYARDVDRIFEKLMLYKKLEQVDGFDENHPNDFNPEATTNVEKAAKNYITKRFVEMSKDPKISSDELRDMRAQITGKEFDKTVEKLANNAMFKDLVKKHPETAYNTWKNIETRSEEMRARCEKEYNDFEETHFHIDVGILRNQNDEVDIDELKSARNDQVLSDMPDMIADRILSAPSNEAVRNAMVKAPEKEQELRTHIRQYIKQVFKEAHSKGALETEDAKEQYMKDFMADKKLDSKILSTFATKQKNRANNNERVVEHEGPHIGPQ